jgi:mannonate dehydratase
MFGDMLKSIRYFHEQSRIFIVHFRNVTSTLPRFTETFLDNGYMDMYQVMKVFVEIGYNGTVILDHSPRFAGDYAKGGGTAYAIGYMRALIERAEAELAACS